MAGFFTTIAALYHQLDQTWQVDNVLFCQGQVTYGLPMDHRVTLPFLNLLKMKGDLIQEYLIYVDPSPLYAT